MTTAGYFIVSLEPSCHRSTRRWLRLRPRPVCDQVVHVGRPNSGSWCSGCGTGLAINSTTAEWSESVEYTGASTLDVMNRRTLVRMMSVRSNWPRSRLMRSRPEAASRRARRRHVDEGTTLSTRRVHAANCCRRGNHGAEVLLHDLGILGIAVSMSVKSTPVLASSSRLRW